MEQVFVRRTVNKYNLTAIMLKWLASGIIYIHCSGELFTWVIGEHPDPNSDGDNIPHYIEDIFCLGINAL